MEEWEEWEFSRTASDEEERCIRSEITRAAIDRIRGRTRPAVTTEPRTVAIAKPAATRTAVCPTAQIVMNTNNENRRLGIPVKGDPKVVSTAFEKRAYTPADARADRDRWMQNAKHASGH